MTDERFNELVGVICGTIRQAKQENVVFNGHDFVDLLHILISNELQPLPHTPYWGGGPDFFTATGAALAETGDK